MSKQALISFMNEMPYYDTIYTVSSQNDNFGLSSHHKILNSESSSLSILEIDALNVKSQLHNMSYEEIVSDTDYFNKLWNKYDLDYLSSIIDSSHLFSTSSPFKNKYGCVNQEETLNSIFNKALKELKVFYVKALWKGNFRPRKNSKQYSDRIWRKLDRGWTYSGAKSLAFDDVVSAFKLIKSLNIPKDSEFDKNLIKEIDKNGTLKVVISTLEKVIFTEGM